MLNLLKKIILIYSFIVPNTLIGQDNYSQVSGKLNAGDSIPVEMWNVPLNVVNHPEGKNTITLDDYRNKKLIILDFWATWCGSCISNLPEIDRLNKLYSDEIEIIPVTTQKREIVLPFLSSNEVLRKLNTWTVYGADSLSRFIEYRTIPHFSWIQDGVLISHSIGKSVNEENIEKVLSESKVDWKQKENINQKKPFVNSLQYDSFDNYIFFKRDELYGPGKTRGALSYDNEQINLYFTNYSLYEIYSFLIRKVITDINKIKEIESILLSSVDESERQNFRKDPVTFQAIFPSDVNYIDIIQILNIFSGYNIEVQWLQVK